MPGTCQRPLQLALAKQEECKTYQIQHAATIRLQYLSFNLMIALNGRPASNQCHSKGTKASKSPQSSTHRGQGLVA
jgi:hypothetical protein